MARMGKVGKQGRIVIPADLRKELEFREGDDVSMYVAEGRLVITTVDRIIEELRHTYDDLPPDVSPVDDLLAERRAEAAREAREFGDEA